nr:unnamed protein product [Callosobruchus analis]
MRKHRVKNMVFDKLHKGFVCVCMAVTVYGMTVLGYRGYKYLTQSKPIIEQKKLLEKQELLAEGASEQLSDLTSTLRT